MGIYIILETGIRVFFMYFLSLKSKVQKKIRTISKKNLHIHIMIL